MTRSHYPTLLRALTLLLLLAFTAACSDGSDNRPFIQPAIDRNLAITVDEPAALPGYNLYRPADLDALGGPLPVIVWANGGCVPLDTPWQILLERWASAGFITLAPSVTASTSLPGARPTTAADQIEALDWVVAENSRTGSAYAGRLDLGRVVAAGNSCGGIVALNVAAVDDRVRAVFVLSGSSAPPGAPEEAFAAVMGNILVPVGYAIGGPEDIATAFAQLDYDLLPAGVPGYIATRFEADHVTVSTDTAILGEVAQIGLQWLDFALYGNPLVQKAVVNTPCPGCAPGTWSVQAKDLDLRR